MNRRRFLKTASTTLIGTSFLGSATSHFSNPLGFSDPEKTSNAFKPRRGHYVDRTPTNSRSTFERW